MNADWCQSKEDYPKLWENWLFSLGEGKKDNDFERWETVLWMGLKTGFGVKMIPYCVDTDKNPFTPKIESTLADFWESTKTAKKGSIINKNAGDSMQLEELDKLEALLQKGIPESPVKKKDKKEKEKKVEKNGKISQPDFDFGPNSTREGVSSQIESGSDSDSGSNSDESSSSSSVKTFSLENNKKNNKNNTSKVTQKSSPEKSPKIKNKMTAAKTNKTKSLSSDESDSDSRSSSSSSEEIDYKPQTQKTTQQMKKNKKKLSKVMIESSSSEDSDSDSSSVDSEPPVKKKKK